MTKFFTPLFIFFSLISITNAEQPWPDYHEPILEGIVSEVVLANKFPFNREKVCVTFLESEKENIGIVEDIRQCHFARKFQHKIGEYIEINEKNNFIILDDNLIDILGEYNPNIKYIIIDFE